MKESEQDQEAELREWCNALDIWVEQSSRQLAPAAATLLSRSAEQAKARLEFLASSSSPTNRSEEIANPAAKSDKFAIQVAAQAPRVPSESSAGHDFTAAMSAYIDDLKRISGQAKESGSQVSYSAWLSAWETAYLARASSPEHLALIANLAAIWAQSLREDPDEQGS